MPFMSRPRFIGSRDMPVIMFQTSVRISPPSISFIGGSSIASWRTSVAAEQKLPLTIPPTSSWWQAAPVQAIRRPSWKIGASRPMSGACSAPL